MLFGGLAVVANALRTDRWKALWAFVAVYLVSLVSELMGTSYGIPFGAYSYTALLGMKWFDRVPVLIPLSWFTMSWACWVIARQRSRGVRKVLLAAALLVAWDLLLDPAMSKVTSYWVWAERGTYYDMPLLNLVGWGVTGLALFIILNKIVPNPNGKLPFALSVYLVNFSLPLGFCVLNQYWLAALAAPLAIAVTLMALSQFCGINAIMYYSTRIFEASGAGKGAAFAASAWVGLINFAFTFVAIGLVDKAGRRPLLLIGTAVQAVALGLVGWMFHTQQSGTALLLCIVLFIAAFSMAMGPIGWLYCSEIFPNKVRGRAMSVAAFSIWVSCYVVAQTFPMLNDSPSVGPAKTFWLYGMVSALSFGFVFAFLRETKGRSLEDIESLWKPAPGRSAGSHDAGATAP